MAKIIIDRRNKDDPKDENFSGYRAHFPDYPFNLIAIFFRRHALTHNKL